MAYAVQILRGNVGRYARRAIMATFGALLIVLLYSTGAAFAQTAAKASWTLGQLVDIAVQTYPGVDAERSAVESGRANVHSARWQFLPSPSVSAETLDGPAVITAELAQPIWAGGRLSANLRLAKARLGSAEWSVAEAQRELALQVVEHYQNFAAASMMLKAYDQYISDLVEFGDMMHRRVAQGYSAEVDAKLAASRLSQAENTRTNLLLSRTTSLKALSQLTGQSLHTANIILPDAHVDEYELAVSDDEFFSRAIDSSPTLNRLTEEISVASAELDQARAARFPVVSLKAQHLEYTDGSAGDDDRIIIAADFALSGGLSVFSDAKAAKSNKQRAYFAREAYRVDFNNELLRNLETLRATRRLIDTLAANRTTQEEIYKSYLRMFLVGQRSWLDVLNVMRESAEAERSLAEAHARFSATLFRLRIQVGDISWTR